MYCPKCGKELREGAAFCNGCGTPQKETSALSNDHVQAKNTNTIIPESARKTMLFLALIAGLFNVIARIVAIDNLLSATVSIIIWSIIPTAILVVFIAFLNKKKPILMVIPLVFPFLSDLVSSLLYRNAMSASQVISYFIELLFIVFTIITISNRKKALKVLAIVSLAIWKCICVSNYILYIVRIGGIGSSYFGDNWLTRNVISQLLFLVWCVCDVVVWMIFLAKIKAKTSVVDAPNNFVIHQQSIMFCPNCGSRFPLGKRFCDQCGNELKETVINNTTRNQYNPQDSKSAGFGVLGFFFPVIGLILYLVWKDSMPLKAKSTGKGALAGAITWVALTILIYVVYFILMASLF